MIRIPLSQNGPKAGIREVIIDDEDGDLEAFSWHAKAAGGGNTMYARRSSDGRNSIYLHRIILERVIGRTMSRDEYCDHIDGNGLNNSRSNLRVATKGQNCANRFLVRGASRYLGVYWGNGMWRAQVRSNNKLYFSGYFDTEEEAARAYDRAATAAHGEFARLNFPAGVEA